MQHRKSSVMALNEHMKLVIRVMDTENDFLNHLKHFEEVFMLPISMFCHVLSCVVTFCLLNNAIVIQN